MDLRKLKTLIDLVSESNISELEITEGEGKVRIVRPATACPTAMMMQPAGQMMMQPSRRPPGRRAAPAAAGRRGRAAAPRATSSSRRWSAPSTARRPGRQAFVEVGEP